MTEPADSTGAGTLLPAAASALVAVVSVGLLINGGRSLTEALVVGGVAGLGAGLLVARRAGAPATADTESSDPSATAAELSPDALVLHAEDGRILYANAAARALFFEGADPAGENFLRLALSAPAKLSRALLAESDCLITLELNQQQETFRLSRHTHLVNDSELTLLVVQNLTREISRREVETLKNVIRVISHEVNNSLAPIASLVHSARLIAERPEHSARLASVFDTIQERAKHLEAFIDGYAKLARLPAPQPQQVKWAPFLEHLRGLYPGAHIAEPDAAPGWFDPVQTEQVLINLMKNALEAGSPEDGVELCVTGDIDGSTRIEIRDRGPGFSEEALSSAFTPFFTTKRDGSGMGHALCREIVHGHGGTIHLSNQKDGGAQVTIVLPGREPVDPRLGSSRTKLTLSRV